MAEQEPKERGGIPIGQKAKEPRRIPLLSRVWDAITKDGYLAAAGRQGASELGQAMKGFPDSIHAEEPGTIWNPTQGEIRAARDIGPTRKNPKLPSPSEVAARNKQPYRPEPGHDNGRESGHGHGREHGHGR